MKGTRSSIANIVLLLVIAVAVGLRILILRSPSAFSVLLSRFELSTPTSGFRRRKTNKQTNKSHTKNLHTKHFIFFFLVFSFQLLKELFSVPNTASHPTLGARHTTHRLCCGCSVLLSQTPLASRPLAVTQLEHLHRGTTHKTSA